MGRRLHPEMPSQFPGSDPNFNRPRRPIDMSSLRKRVVVLGVMVLSIFAFQGSVFAAKSDKCTAITSVPFTITAGGSYCLTQDFIMPGTFTSGTAIAVTVDNVTI